MTNRAIHGVLELYIRLIINRATGEVDYDICIGRGHQIWRGLSYSLSSQGIYRFIDQEDNYLTTMVCSHIRKAI